MTEEIIINEKSLQAVLKRYDELEQENKELKKENRYYKAELKLSCNELDKSNNWQIAERQEKNKYRSALEEINRTLLGVRGLSINCDKQIIKVKTIINEVLE